MSAPPLVQRSVSAFQLDATRRCRFRPSPPFSAMKSVPAISSLLADRVGSSGCQALSKLDERLRRNAQPLVRLPMKGMRSPG
jgi:hypothetical protein